jgi:hypothetical protein
VSIVNVELSKEIPKILGILNLGIEEILKEIPKILEILKEIPKILGILMNVEDNCQFLKF